ncbi:MAG: LytTR family DNA-binding domain-containing protein [Acetobacter sp.]|nr:LytTR family DNA-binding domain-containing protein [Bacteroides sp.]MCM1341013.1 LytTR family DNA-binding domain-containing protein [Acetobacter sp.]MCM1432431.1 LytTR family DNA-binding domain-containing protein [Clostridiales bacterium]
MTINALICDDEQTCSETIINYLEKYCDEHNIDCFYDSFDNTEEAAKSESLYNIAFLDIEIDKKTGLDIAEHLKKKNKNIIIFFITNYEKYMDNAMDYLALRFLKKPLDYSRFYSGLDRAVELISNIPLDVYIKESSKITKINSNDILYIETLSRKTKIVTENETYYSKELIDDWQKELTLACFRRIHKSFIINLNYVKKYKRCEVILTNNEIIPISYRCQKDFREFFDDYIRRRR